MVKLCSPLKPCARLLAASGLAALGVIGAEAAENPARKPLQVEPVRAADAEHVKGKTYDVIVIGGTPGGIACAVRSSREGLSVLLVQHNGHIGGMLTNGLMQWDALYAGHRAPIFNEYARLIENYYRTTYGEGSPQWRLAQLSQKHYPLSRFEPGVAEHLFNQLVSAEKNITTLLNHVPASVAREGALIKSVVLRDYEGDATIQVNAQIFVDATYEGDLAALAKVPYRAGREGRDEFKEPHAGKVFTNISDESGPQDAKDGKLNLHLYGHTQGSIDPQSPFTADGAIQAFNYRFCLTSEVENRRLPNKPPGYNREEYVNYYRKSMNGGPLNGKGTFNSAILPGENHAYPDADWPAREKIIERHKHFALGLMYFLQNDESVPEAKRKAYRQIGLPLDEYTDNANVPYEMYVREARRIVGRHVFTEHDNRLALDYARTPINADSIAITDWSMDSHDCTTDRRPGYAYDGKLILTEESRPAQVPYRSLLPKGIDNLLVPVCLSATHVAWGAVRLEPVWMQIGEAAGVAATLAIKRKLPPAQIDTTQLVRGLCKRRCMVTFFNDVDVSAKDDDRIPAAEFFGTQGFFSSYDARLDVPVTEAIAKVWQEGFVKLQAGSLQPRELAAAVHRAEATDSVPGSESRGAVLLKYWNALRRE